MDNEREMIVDIMETIEKSKRSGEPNKIIHIKKFDREKWDKKHPPRSNKT